MALYFYIGYIIWHFRKTIPSTRDISVLNSSSEIVSKETIFSLFEKVFNFEYVSLFNNESFLRPRWVELNGTGIPMPSFVMIDMTICKTFNEKYNKAV